MTNLIIKSNYYECESLSIKTMSETITHLISIFKQSDEVEISAKIRLFLANEILPKAYVKYSECKSESKQNMKKTVEFIRNRLMKITYRDKNGNEYLRKICDLERIWIRELLQDILKTWSSVDSN